jgi:hypothetical protein
MPAKSKSPSSIPFRRERRGEASGRALVDAWQASGLPQAAFARRRGVSAQRLSYWHLRLGPPCKPGRAVSDAAFVEIPPAAPAISAGLSRVIVVMAGGVHVHVERGFDPVVLCTVVAALSRPVPAC